MRVTAVAASPFDALLAGSTVLWGRVAAVKEAEGILVTGRDGTLCVCDVLRTTSAALPLICEGDAVLYVFDDERARGCVLGVIAAYIPEPEPDRIRIAAREAIELRCGDSSLTMTKTGRVTIKGEQVLSRATGVNKIKGAAVKIN
jgi:hypothetical protein